MLILAVDDETTVAEMIRERILHHTRDIMVVDNGEIVDVTADGYIELTSATMAFPKTSRKSPAFFSIPHNSISQGGSA